jgi:hypothetical protein
VQRSLLGGLRATLDYVFHRRFHVFALVVVIIGLVYQQDGMAGGTVAPVGSSEAPGLQSGDTLCFHLWSRTP